MRASMILGLFLICLVGDSARASAVVYDIQDLGVLPGGTWSGAYGISESGLVVGAALVGGWNHAFLYDGTMHDLGALPSGRPESKARAVNNSGQVVGYSNTHPGEYSREHAFLYDGTMRDLGVLPGGWISYANAINNAGQVAGYSTTSATDGYYYHAFVYDGTMRDIGTLAGRSSYAYGINERGQVVGYSWTANGDHAFLYDGTMRDLGTLPGGFGSYARSINEAGLVVGYGKQGYYDSKGNLLYFYRAFLYDGTMNELGTLGGQYSSNYASAINDSNQVVGYYLTSSSYNHAFLYDGTMHDLNDLIDPASGWTLYEAYDINNLGQIVGYGVSPLGQGGAFLLTPIPEPSSLLALAGGIVGLGGFALRRRRPV